MSPFVTNFKELLLKIQENLESGRIGIYLTKDSDNSIFEELLVQELIRTIDGESVSFLAIRNIVLVEPCRGLKLLSNFLEELEKLNVNIMFHDTINSNLQKFLNARGYIEFKEQKYEHALNSMYLLKIDK